MRTYQDHHFHLKMASNPTFCRKYFVANIAFVTRPLVEFFRLGHWFFFTLFLITNYNVLFLFLGFKIAPSMAKARKEEQRSSWAQTRHDLFQEG
jgi:hypothetical protein